MRNRHSFVLLIIAFTIVCEFMHAQVDSVRSLEVYLGVTFENTAEEDGGVRIVNASGDHKLKGEVVSPEGKIITWVNTTSLIPKFKKDGIRVKNKTELTRAVFLLKSQGAEKVYFLTEKGIAQRVWHADVSGLQLDQVASPANPQTSPPVNADTGSTPTASKPVVANDTNVRRADSGEMLKEYCEIEFGLTLSNKYAIGNLNTWFSERTGEAGTIIDEGPTSYLYIGVSLMKALQPLKERSVYAGIGFHLTKPPKHSIYEAIFINPSIYLNPYISSVSVPIKFPLMKSLAVSASPAFLLAWAKGNYMQDFDVYNFRNSIGMGFALTLGAEVVLARRFGINLKCTYRLLKVKLLYDDETSARVGYNQPLLNNGDQLQLDLGGLAITTGISFRFGK